MIRMNLRNYVGKIAIVGFAALAIGTAIGAGILFYQKNELNGRVAALESQLESQVGGIARAQATAENSYDGLKDRVAALESQLESQVESIESIARAQATAEDRYVTREEIDIDALRKLMREYSGEELDRMVPDDLYRRVGALESATNILTLENSIHSAAYKLYGDVDIGALQKIVDDYQRQMDEAFEVQLEQGFGRQKTWQWSGNHLEEINYPAAEISQTKYENGQVVTVMWFRSYASLGGVGYQEFDKDAGGGVVEIGAAAYGERPFRIFNGWRIAAGIRGGEYFDFTGVEEWHIPNLFDHALYLAPTLEK